MENLQALSSSDRQLLRKQLRPAILLSIGILFMITAVNLSFHYMDVLTGVETVERPPVSRLFVILFLAIVIALSTFLFLTANVRKDLKSGIKKYEKSRVKRKYLQMENGTRLHKVNLQNGTILSIGIDLYNVVNENDLIEFSQAEKSKIVFSTQLIS